MLFHVERTTSEFSLFQILKTPNSHDWGKCPRPLNPSFLTINLFQINQEQIQDHFLKNNILGNLNLSILKIQYTNQQALWHEP